MSTMPTLYHHYVGIVFTSSEQSCRQYRQFKIPIPPTPNFPLIDISRFQESYQNGCTNKNIIFYLFFLVLHFPQVIIYMKKERVMEYMEEVQQICETSQTGGIKPACFFLFPKHRYAYRRIEIGQLMLKQSVWASRLAQVSSF